MTTFQSFTTAYPGVVNVLTNEVRVSEPFQPGTTTQLLGTVFVAVWDTGATHTVISQAVVDKLDLKPTGQGRVFTASGSMMAEKYCVSILLPNRVVFPIVEVTKSQPRGCDLLIGMDIIGSGDFAVSNFGGQTKFTFRHPSRQAFDFVRADSRAPAKSAKVGPNEQCPCGSGTKYKKCCGARSGR